MKRIPARTYVIIIFTALFCVSILFNIRSLLNTGSDQISAKDISQAAKVADVSFTAKEIRLMTPDIVENVNNYRELRKHPLDNSVFPALDSQVALPLVGKEGVPGPFQREQIRLPENLDFQVPEDLEKLAFAPVTVLAELIRTGKITSVALTEMYLNRLKRYDPVLKCVITLTEDLAMQQAKRADEEIAAGKYRGPLHGIPWGAKDLLATKGYKTTWGAMPYKDQLIDLDATVVKRLDEAGAVLVAKLSLGALAWGDVWFGGTTKNPWNTEQGSSGSSAGPASATSAGLVGFSIGTETWGSIVSPSTRCGVTGLRPTYGRVSRYGAMALSWSMDKIGPICRSVEDCALVFNAIYGPDGKDFTVKNVPFHWDRDLDVKTLRVGYLKNLFEADYKNKANDAETLKVLRDMGVELVPIDLPDFPVSALSFILSAEASAAFDDLTRSNKDDLMVRQVRFAWPNSFRFSRLIPAVEYIRANRFRTLLMQRMAEILKDIDVYLAPSFGGDNLLLTNLTGHPAVVVPNGFDKDKSPTSITFMGNLFAEHKALALAMAYQNKTSFNTKNPPF